MSANILTICSAGLCRSVALADVIKLHFEPADAPETYPDVIPAGIDKNSKVFDLLYPWADKIVVMQEKFAKRIPEEWASKVMICEVGPDRYGHSHNSELIGMVWNWTRQNLEALNLKEHQRKC